MHDEVIAMGRIDVLVNNAGVNGPTVPNRESPSEDWRRVIAVDLIGGRSVY